MAQNSNSIDQLQSQQSAQLGQQFVADQQKRKQQKGGGKSIVENLIPWFISPDYEIVNSFVGSFISTANLVPLTSMPSIAQFFKIRVSLWKEGTFMAQDDILSAIDKAKQNGGKEDLALNEKQKFDQTQHDNKEIHDSSKHQSDQGQKSNFASEQSNKDSNHQQKGQQDSNDSHRNYWSNVNMLNNQARANLLNKNADNFEALEHFLREQNRVIEWSKQQSQLIENINRQKQRSRAG
jgi:hypothetical protein